MNAVTKLVISTLEHRRRLAQALLDGYAADAFAEPATPEDLAYYRAEIAECDAELAKLLKT
jgi:hypothetical protein